MIKTYYEKVYWLSVYTTKQLEDMHDIIGDFCDISEDEDDDIVNRINKINGYVDLEDITYTIEYKKIDTNQDVNTIYKDTF